MVEKNRDFVNKVAVCHFWQFYYVKQSCLYQMFSLIIGFSSTGVVP